MNYKDTFTDWRYFFEALPSLDLDYTKQLEERFHMERSISSKITQFIILMILSVFCFISGRKVIAILDADFISHSAVPLKYSLIFVFLLIGIGIIFGFLINVTSVFGKVILWWPFMHFAILLLCYYLGQVWEILLGLALYTVIVLPINLIGEGVSLGFQMNWLIFQRNNKNIVVVLIGLLLNIIVIIYVINKISKDYLANLFM
ncbi:hypothetical protein [Paenibacillus apis]|nr:hypothetical protein [Paenibacillus apis]